MNSASSQGSSSTWIETPCSSDSDFDFEASGVGQVVTRRAWLVGAGLLLVPSAVFAAPKSRDVERYEREVPGASSPAGAARAGVSASHSQVEKVVTDYAGYARVIPQFERARVVGRSGSATDLFLEIPILHGLTSIWAVLRFGAPERQAKATVVRGKMLKGNVNRLDVTWRVEAMESDWTRLTAELLLDIKLPAPESAVLKTVKRAAAQAVKGVRQEAEQRATRRA